jgi:2-(1,2-epoxy-1,2-dihydrophenyl)acetyl-CoA isomerase
MSESILHEKIEHIAKISFNRPKVFNSFDQESALRLLNIMETYEADDDVRIIYLTGIGKAFSAGQDLNEIISGKIPLEEIVEKHYNPIVLQIYNSSKIYVAAVNGVAAGAGANIALVCDMTLATESATFIQAFSKIGLIPDSGGTYVLPRLVGFQKALGLALTGDKVSAQEAERLGMIYKYFSDDSFEEETWKMAEKLASLPPIGLSYTKKLYNIGICNNLEDQLHQEMVYQNKAGVTEDYQECVNAFLEKRKPVIKGK